MEQPVAVQQIIGNIPAAPLTGAAPQQSYGQVPGFIPAPEAAVSAATALPPGLHWGLVLLLSAVTFGLFSWVWMFVQASFVKKIRPASNAIMWYALSLAVLLIGSFVAGLLSAGAPDAEKSIEG